MNVETHYLRDWMASKSATFSVPLFQRPYSWDRWQCEVMWNDLEKAIDTGSAHFFGAIFYRSGLDRYDRPTVSLIDGQQRTLTTFLLISALYDEMPDGETREAARSLLFRSPAEDKGADGSLTLRVVPARKDEEDFVRAIEPSENGKAASADADAGADASANASQGESEIAREGAGADADGQLVGRASLNKGLFLEAIRTSSHTPEQIWEGLDQLQVVVIELEPEDNAQEIFESFNSKGVPLVTADLVRNYLLLSKDPEEQVRLYEEYWEPIQGLFGDDPGSLRLNNAIRAWTVIRCKTPHAKSDSEAFEDFKQYLDHEFDGTAEELMDELLSFCSVWAENYRYHAVKKFRSRDWAKIGRKTLVSGRKAVPVSREVKEYYSKQFGIHFKEDEEES